MSNERTASLLQSAALIMLTSASGCYRAEAQRPYEAWDGDTAGAEADPQSTGEGDEPSTSSGPDDGSTGDDGLDTGTTGGGEAMPWMGQLAWVSQLGFSEWDRANAVAALPDGGVVIAGHFMGERSAGDLNLTSRGETDAYVARLDSNGSLLWARQIGGPAWDWGYGVVVVGDRIVVAGVFGQVAQLDGHSLTSAGSTDVFLAAYDFDGDIIGARRGGGPGIEQMAAMQPWKGGFLMTGRYDTGTSFGDGQVPLSSSGVYVAQYESNLNLVWARTAVAGVLAYGGGIVTTPDGGFAISGVFDGTATIDPGGAAIAIADDSTELHSYDVYIAQFDANATLQWTRTIGGSGQTVNFAGVTSLSDGSLAIAGDYVGEVTFAAGEPNEKSFFVDEDGQHSFVALYRPDGTFTWAQQGVSDDLTATNAVFAAPDDRILVMGRKYTGPSMTFMPGTGQDVELAADDAGFIATFDAGGQLLSADGVCRVMGLEGGYADIHGAATMADGAVVLTGEFRRSTTGGAIFGEGTPSETLLVSDPGGWGDSMVMRLDP